MGTSGLSLFTSSRCDNRACCVHKREEEEIYETAFVCVYLMDNSRHCFFVWLQLGTLFSWPHLNCIDFHNDKKNICLNGALYIRMITHWIYYYGISEFLMIFLWWYFFLCVSPGKKNKRLWPLFDLRKWRNPSERDILCLRFSLNDGWRPNATVLTQCANILSSWILTQMKSSALYDMHMHAREIIAL